MLLKEYAAYIRYDAYLHKVYHIKKSMSILTANRDSGVLTPGSPMQKKGGIVYEGLWNVDLRGLQEL